MQALVTWPKFWQHLAFCPCAQIVNHWQTPFCQVFSDYGLYDWNGSSANKNRVWMIWYQWLLWWWWLFCRHLQMDVASLLHTLPACTALSTATRGHLQMPCWSHDLTLLVTWWLQYCFVGNENEFCVIIQKSENKSNETIMTGSQHHGEQFSMDTYFILWKVLW